MDVGTDRIGNVKDGYEMWINYEYYIIHLINMIFCLKLQYGVLEIMP